MPPLTRITGVALLALLGATALYAQTPTSVQPVEYGPQGALVVIDDVRFGTQLRISDRHLALLDVRSITVMEPAAAMRLYGDSARRGAVVVQTGPESASPRAATPSRSPGVAPRIAPKELAPVAAWLELPPEKRPLLIVDGRPIGDPGTVQFDPDRIEAIEVVKGAAATELWGPLGGNGIVIVKSRPSGR